MKVKPALTYDEQLNRLEKEHNLKIDNRQIAIKIIERVNYYRLSGYGIGLKKVNNPEHYIDDIDLNFLFNLYCFDSQFKHDLMKTLEQIEIQLRSQLAYYIALSYGALGYMDVNNFDVELNKSVKSTHTSLIDNLGKEIYRQRNKPFVKHHIDKYNGDFPIWVAVELFSFGNLSSLFSILKYKDQKSIAKLYGTEPKYIKSWILCLVEVRNICAHYTRLYNLPLKQTPRLYTENQKYQTKQNKIFPVLLTIKRMLNSNEQWKSLLKDIKATFYKYKGCYNLNFMSFPQDWYEVLSSDFN